MALRLQPDSASLHNNLGNVLTLQGRYDDAAVSYQQALGLRPEYAEAHSNLADVLSSLGKNEDAVTHCREALRLQPGYAGAYNNLGNAYKGLGKLREAMDCFRKSLTLDPDLVEARINLGVALDGLGKLDEAVAQFRGALRLKPDSAAACLSLGTVFLKQKNWHEARAAFQRARELTPNRAGPYYSLGQVLAGQGNMEEATDLYREALRLEPDHIDAHWALALALLTLGDFERGWPEHEWRWRLKQWSPQKLPQPVWDGSPLAGRTILLYGEGGYGDAIQFVRYAPVVKQYGGRVVVGCREPLMPLLASCPGIDQLVAIGSPLPEFDVQAPLMSLPWILKTSLSTVPAEVPYLRPNAKLQKQWQRRLGRYSGFKVGIAWQGNPEYSHDRNRSIPLLHYAPLARLPGVCLISLQKGCGTEQLEAVSEVFPVIDLGSRLDHGDAAFRDTAAIMKSLDLVITSDTAVAHLAGALGVPVWVALSYAAEWRWLLEREDSPWYPTMRLFRQTKLDDWEGVFARMAEELAHRVEEPQCGGNEISPSKSRQAS
jgi:tetratricopeptide (TPR) repeat protein